MKSGLFLIFFFLLYPWVFCFSASPNIIFIMADDMGYGDLGVYGQTKFQTPRMDVLAGEGIRFTQAYAGGGLHGIAQCPDDGAAQRAHPGPLGTGPHEELDNNGPLSGSKRDVYEGGIRVPSSPAGREKYRTDYPESMYDGRRARGNP